MSEQIELYDSRHTGPVIDDAVDRILKTPGTGAITPNEIGAASAETQTKVFRTARPATVAVTLDASALQGYLNALPRYLSDNIDITVTGTTANQTVIMNFHGPGSIYIHAPALGDCILTYQFLVSSNSLMVRAENLKFVCPSGGLANLVSCGDAMLTMTNCIVDGSAVGEIIANTPAAVISQGESHIIMNNCGVNNYWHAIRSNLGGRFSIDGANSAFANNSIGAYLAPNGGGIVNIGALAPQLLGGASHAVYTGLITHSGKVISGG